MQKEIELGQIDQCWNAPERVVLVTSRDGAGRDNMIAVGWLMRASMEPPVYAVGLNGKSHSGRTIAASGEFAIAVPGADLAAQVMYCGTHTGSEVDKFAATGLTAVRARTIGAPLVAECLANVECRVIATQAIGDHRVFFGQVQACWVHAERGSEPGLLVVGEGPGYRVAHCESGFRLGVVAG